MRIKKKEKLKIKYKENFFLINYLNYAKILSCFFKKIVFYVEI